MVAVPWNGRHPSQRGQRKILKACLPGSDIGRTNDGEYWVETDSVGRVEGGLRDSWEMQLHYSPEQTGEEP
jgi:hypothetical protein